MKITSATITPMPRPMPEGMFDPMPKVVATFGEIQHSAHESFVPFVASRVEAK